MLGSSDRGERFRPVVAIEVDGLLRIPVAGDCAPEDVLELEITMKHELYPSASRHEPPWIADQWHARHWISRGGLNWVRERIAEGTEVVWASTWGLCANHYFGEALSLPQLEVAVQADGGRHESISGWKAAHLAARFDGRPVLWVNDELNDSRVQTLERLCHPSDRVLTHLHCIQMGCPISASDVQTMNAWLSLTRSQEGHDELQRQRRREQDRARRRVR